MMGEYVVASFSGGKDSTAMVLHMLEIGEHIDEVVTTDTGMEFPAMYEHIEKVKAIIESYGVKFTILRAEHTFEWYMLEKPVKSRKWGDHVGYGWPTPVIRWCTKHLKVILMEDYYKSLEGKKVIRCIGLAADEVRRLNRAHNQQEGHRHPLAEWGWTEADCLRYCYDRGLDWGGLYEQFNRVSCWCCPLAALSELRTLWRLYPELWAKLEEWDTILDNRDVGAVVKFRGDYTVRDLAARFEREALAEKEQTSLDDFIRIPIIKQA